MGFRDMRQELERKVRTRAVYLENYNGCLESE